MALSLEDFCQHALGTKSMCCAALSLFCFFMTGTSYFRSLRLFFCQALQDSVHQVRYFARLILFLLSKFVVFPDMSWFCVAILLICQTCHGSVQQVCSFARHIMVPFSKFVVFLGMSWFRSSSSLFFPGISGFHSASLPLRTTCTRRRT